MFIVAKEPKTKKSKTAKSAKPSSKGASKPPPKAAKPVKNADSKKKSRKDSESEVGSVSDNNFPYSVILYVALSGAKYTPTHFISPAPIRRRDTE